MTHKKVKNGQFATESKQVKHEVEECSKIAKQVGKTAERIVALAMSAVWFAAIFMVAVGLGFGLHWGQVHWTWMPAWMFQVGHYIENFFYVVDCISIVAAVGLHAWKALKEMFTKE